MGRDSKPPHNQPTNQKNQPKTNMLINKITHGYVIQMFDTETGKCQAQSFVAGDECEYEKMQTGENFNVDHSEVELEYQPYDMVQP